MKTACCWLGKIIELDIMKLADLTTLNELACAIILRPVRFASTSPFPKAVYSVLKEIDIAAYFTKKQFGVVKF